LHPRAQNHSPEQSTGAATRKQLPPGKTVQVLAVQDVFDHIELSLHRRRLGRRSMALKSSEDFTGFVKFSLADQETRAVWEERAEAPDADGEENLESERKAPSDVAGGEGEA
jgi:hypothetical protein